MQASLLFFLGKLESSSKVFIPILALSSLRLLLTFLLCTGALPCSFLSFMLSSYFSLVLVVFCSTTRTVFIDFSCLAWLFSWYLFLLVSGTAPLARTSFYHLSTSVSLDRSSPFHLLPSSDVIRAWGESSVSKILALCDDLSLIPRTHKKQVLLV